VERPLEVDVKAVPLAPSHGPRILPRTRPPPAPSRPGLPPQIPRGPEHAQRGAVCRIAAAATQMATTVQRTRQTSNTTDPFTARRYQAGRDPARTGTGSIRPPARARGGDGGTRASHGAQSGQEPPSIRVRPCQIFADTTAGGADVARREGDTTPPSGAREWPRPPSSEHPTRASAGAHPRAPSTAVRAFRRHPCGRSWGQSLTTRSPLWSRPWCTGPSGLPTPVDRNSTRRDRCRRWPVRRSPIRVV
jgi:hypothetical protein